VQWATGAVGHHWALGSTRLCPACHAVGGWQARPVAVCGPVRGHGGRPGYVRATVVVEPPQLQEEGEGEEEGEQEAEQEAEGEGEGVADFEGFDRFLDRI
jgi:hypothetical protein